MNSNQVRVVVFAGGTSPEREVSLQGGRAVESALKRRGFETVWLDPAEDSVSDFLWQAGDVAFLVLHGAFGEDGQVQTLLESRNIPYTGSDAAASRVAFSKSATKERLQLAHIPTPDSVIISRGDAWESLKRRAASLGYPLVVKPDTQGSSLGVTVVYEENQLQAAVEQCLALDTFGLLEKFIAGSEWTVGLWNDQALPPICIETPRGFYDYTAKYADDETQYHFESNVPATHLERLKRIAVRVGQAVGTRGIARVDLRLNADCQPWVLEINTIPGLTDHSLIPKAAAKWGIEFPDLCERIVRETLVQHGSQRAA